MIPIVMSAIAIVISLLSVIIAERIRRLQRLQHLKGPELHIYFAQHTKEQEDLLVLENVGEAALQMDVSVYVDPKKDDRYPYASQPVWIFRRKLYPERPKRWMHSFQAVLNEMGYRQDCTYIVRFVGTFWPLVTGKKFSRDYYQQYQASLTSKGWLYVEQSDRDWYYADDKPRVNLRRDGIPEELRK